MHDLGKALTGTEDNRASALVLGFSTSPVREPHRAWVRKWWVHYVDTAGGTGQMRGCREEEGENSKGPEG